MKTLEKLFQEHLEFTKRVFPKSTRESSLIGLKREIKEVESAILDYAFIDGYENKHALGLEYIDCMMYLLDSMERAGFEVDDIPNLFSEKLKINKGRGWKQNKDGSYSHI